MQKHLENTEETKECSLNNNTQYVADAALPYLKEAGFQVVIEEGYPVDRKDFIHHSENAK